MTSVPPTFPSVDEAQEAAEGNWPTIVNGEWKWISPPRGLRVVGEAECNPDYYASQFALVDRFGKTRAMYDCFHRSDYEVKIKQPDGSGYVYDREGLVGRNPQFDWSVTERMWKQKGVTMALMGEDTDEEYLV